MIKAGVESHSTNECTGLKKYVYISQYSALDSSRLRSQTWSTSWAWFERGLNRRTGTGLKRIAFRAGSKLRRRRSVVPPSVAATTISLLSIVRSSAVAQRGRKRRWAVTRLNLDDGTASM